MPVSLARSFRAKDRLCPRTISNTFLATANKRSTPRNQEEYSSPRGEDGRGDVYAELELACDELDRTLEQLKKAGYTFREFAKVLETDPTGVLMTHYPSGYMIYFFFSSRRRHTRFDCDWSSDVCSSD